MNEGPSFPPNLALLVSIVAVSTASILIRWSAAPPLAIASYRLLFATIILLPFYLRSGGLRRLRGFPRRDVLTLMAVGVVLAMHFASWITSLSLTSVTSSVLFVHLKEDFGRMALHADYFNPEGSREPNPGLKSIPSTRPLSALPLVASMRHQGLAAIRRSLRAPLAAIEPQENQFGIFCHIGQRAPFEAVLIIQRRHQTVQPEQTGLPVHQSSKRIRIGTQIVRAIDR